MFVCLCVREREREREEKRKEKKAKFIFSFLRSSDQSKHEVNKCFWSGHKCNK